MYDCFRCQLQHGNIIYILRTYERYVDSQQCCARPVIQYDYKNI
jgi:hypothetical protein